MAVKSFIVQTPDVLQRLQNSLNRHISTNKYHAGAGIVSEMVSLSIDDTI
jgi:hypothetical protein